MPLRATSQAIVTLALLAGCDGATPEPTPAAIQLTTPFADIEMTVDDEGVTIQLADHFFAGAAHLTFTAEVSGDAASLDWDDQANRILRIEPVSMGEAQVTVTARSAGGVSRSETFEVRVLLGRCPPPAGAERSDYFPLTVGQEWRFEYERETVITAAGSFRNVGESSLTVTSATCEGGRRRATVHFHAAGESFYMAPYPNPPEWTNEGPYLISDTAYFDEGSDNVVTFQVPDFSCGLGVPRYASVMSPTVMAYGGITLTQGVGLTSLSGHCSHGHHGSSHITMTRVL